MMAILSGFSIGTPATRAETIKKLKDAGYIKAKGKSLSCTDLGKILVETFPARELLIWNIQAVWKKHCQILSERNLQKTIFSQ